MAYIFIEAYSKTITKLKFIEISRILQENNSMIKHWHLMEDY